MSAEFLLLFDGGSSNKDPGGPDWLVWLILAFFVLVFAFTIFGLVMCFVMA